MSFENPTPGESNPGFVLCCNLKTLQDRSQTDFEIDFFEQILSRDPGYSDVLFVLGDLFAEKGLPRRALRVDLRLAELNPKHPSVFYNLACSHALLGHELASLEALERAVELGFSDVEYMLVDPDLVCLRQMPRFRRLADRLIEAAGRPTVV